jgi:hypothetical protein
MAKNPIPLAPDVRPTRRRSRLLPIAALLILIPLMSPLILEVLSLCYAQWNEMLDTPVAVRTPILDSISERLEAVREDLRFWVLAGFDRVPWNPNVVLPVLVVVMAVGVMMLRR